MLKVKYLILWEINFFCAFLVLSEFSVSHFYFPVYMYICACVCVYVYVIQTYFLDPTKT